MALSGLILIVLIKINKMSYWSEFCPTWCKSYELKCGRRRLKYMGKLQNLQSLFGKSQKLAHEHGTFWPDFDSTHQNKQNELLLRVLPVPVLKLWNQKWPTPFEMYGEMANISSFFWKISKSSAWACHFLAWFWLYSSKQRKWAIAQNFAPPGAIVMKEKVAVAMRNGWGNDPHFQGLLEKSQEVAH